MSTAPSISIVAQIGETAGQIWRVLNEKGPLSMAKLVKAVGQPRDMVMQGVGWLAREDKIWLQDEARCRMIYLK